MGGLPSSFRVLRFLCDDASAAKVSDRTPQQYIASRPVVGTVASWTLYSVRICIFACVHERTSDYWSHTIDHHPMLLKL
jgi:hypothetical protein